MPLQTLRWNICNLSKFGRTFALLGSKTDRIALDSYEVAMLLVSDLMQNSVSFADPGVSTFSQLLFDVSRDQVIVGAR